MTTAENEDVLLRVVVGDARIESRWGAERVTASHTAFVSGPTGRPFVSVSVPSLSDGFEHWSASRTRMATLVAGSPDRTVIDQYTESQGVTYAGVGIYSQFGPGARGNPREQSGQAQRGSRGDRGDRHSDRRGRGKHSYSSREEEDTADNAPPARTAPQSAAPAAGGSFRTLAKPRS